MKFLSLFSGIEAASVAWIPLGWECVGHAEVEASPSAVLQHHYPNVPNYGDVTKFKEWSIEPGSFDVLVGGSPCQSFSVAGLRKGLDDPRGNLMLTYLAILGHFRPRWMVWENVPGVLSSNRGRDFGTFLGGLAQLGYGFGYRILDAQYVRVESHPRAVPQRRRRVLVVGHSGDWRRAAAVLFERESLSGYPPPSRTEGKRVAGRLKGGTKDGHLIPVAFQSKASSSQSMNPSDVAPGIDVGKADGIAVCYENHGQDSRIKETGDVSPQINAKAGTGGNNLPIIAFKPTNSAQSRSLGESEEVSPTISGAEGGNKVSVAFAYAPVPLYIQGNSQENRYGDAEKTRSVEILQALRDATGEEAFLVWCAGVLAAFRPAPLLQQALHGIGVRFEGVGRCWVVDCALSREEDLPARAMHQVWEAQGEGCASRRWGPSEQLARELGTYLSKLSQPGPQEERFMCDLWQADEGVGILRHALSAIQEVGRSADGKSKPTRTGDAHTATLQVRRLTPTECLFLQGFPRGYLDVPNSKGKPMADGPRYKMLGNSMATNVMRWIGERIAMVASITINGEPHE